LDAKATIRRLERDPLSPLARHALGLGVLLLTIVPAYGYFGSKATQQESEIMRMARETVEATDSSVEIAEIVEIEAHIREVAVRYDIQPILVAAIVEAESEFNPRAVSRRGAQGLMQLMPGTASSLRVSDTFDPYENIEGGVRHLRRLMDRYRGNLPLVLAAYNAGEQAVMVYGGVPPYRETRQYVNRILRRIGRPDLVPQPRVSHVHATVIPVATTRIDPGFALLSPPPPAPSASSLRSAWAERQALERQAAAKVERSTATATATATAAATTQAQPSGASVRESSWSGRTNGQGP
jgi:Transglycosylase SLT domain